MMKSLAITVGCLTLVACGGGGGDGSSASSTPSTTTAALTSANQNIVAQEASSTAFLPVTSAELMTGAQTINEGALFDFAKVQLRKLPTYFVDAKSNNSLTGVIQNQTYACAYGGTVSVATTDVNNDGVLSANDSITLSANSCRESAGTLNGSLAATVSQLTGTYGSTAYTANISMSFNGFSFTSAQLNAIMNGTLSLNSNVSGVHTATETITAPSLTVSATFAGAQRTRTLTAYTCTMTETPDATYTYLRRYSINGDVTSSALSSQTVHFSTPTPLVERPSDANPSSGTILIVGAGNSQIRLTAVSASQLKQELDANGDGTFESSSTVDWNSVL